MPGLREREYLGCRVSLGSGTAEPFECGVGIFLDADTALEGEAEKVHRRNISALRRFVLLLSSQFEKMLQGRGGFVRQWE